MSDREAKLAELRRLRKLDELRQLRDSATKAEPSLAEKQLVSPSVEGASNMFFDTLNRYGGAPARAGIEAAAKASDTETFPGVMQAFGGAFADQFGEDPKPMAGAAILKRAGVPSTFPGAPAGTLNPRKIGGAAFDFGTDPSTYLAPPGASLEAKLVTRGPAMAEEWLEKAAAERATKAALGGQNAAAARQAAGIATKRAGPTEKALENYRNVGRSVLAEDEMLGKSPLGWFSSTEGIQDRAAPQMSRLRNEMDDVDSKLNEAGAFVPGRDVAEDILQYASTIPDTARGRSLQARLMRDAEHYAKREKIPYAEAKAIKGDFQYKDTAHDELISNQDATNKMNGIFERQLDKAAESSDPRLAERRAAANAKYAPRVQIEDAATQRAVKDRTNRSVSLSDYITAVVTGGAMLAGHGASPATVVATVAAGAANHMARTRGNAFLAKSLQKMSQAFSLYPKQMVKYESLLRNAAVAGQEALIARHHWLMNSDPTYRDIVSDEEP